MIMAIAIAVIAPFAGYIAGYSVSMWEHGIKFDNNGQRIDKRGQRQ